MLLILLCFFYRSSHRSCSVRKGFLKDFAKFAGKYLCQSLLFNKVAYLITKPLQSRHSKVDTSLKWILFPCHARLFLPEFTSVKPTKKYFDQRIENSLFSCFYVFFSSKHLFTTHSCSLIIKLTFFDTQVTPFLDH